MSDCCMARHATAIPPWTCDCPCHHRTAAVNEEVMTYDELAADVAGLREQLDALNQARAATADERDELDVTVKDYQREVAGLREQLQQAQEQTAWLVEIQPAGGPQWWTGRGDEWTAEVDGTKLNPAHGAMRFSRREDAERAIGWLIDKNLARGCKATEHLWL